MSRRSVLVSSGPRESEEGWAPPRTRRTRRKMQYSSLPPDTLFILTFAHDFSCHLLSSGIPFPNFTVIIHWSPFSFFFSFLFFPWVLLILNDYFEGQTRSPELLTRKYPEHVNRQAAHQCLSTIFNPRSYPKYTQRIVYYIPHKMREGGKKTLFYTLTA